jgi:hypothetical protein
MPRHEMTFLELIQTFRRGILLEEGDQKLNELVDAMQATGSGGTLTIDLKFKVNKAAQLECDAQVKIKKPTRALGTGIFFATDDGRLTRRDPNQMDIEDEIERRRSLEP